MASLPPVALGAVMMGAFVVIFGLRLPMERRLVGTSSMQTQPKRQFVLDLALYLAAGLIAVTFLRIVYHLPTVNAMHLLLGYLVSGFFMSLDMALTRERGIIVEAMERNERLPPPKKLFPVTRKFSLVAVVSALFVALILILVISRDIVWLSGIEPTAAALASAQRSVAYEIFFIVGVLMVVIVNLIVSYSKNLKLLFNNETSVLERVTNGDLSRLVPVATADEFGLIADYTNAMIMGLRDRIKIIGQLKLAEEVQQNLIPERPPLVSGLEVSGTSIYCDETGGDYYDYLDLGDRRLGIVVADAADHGVGAALHMLTARAFLKSAVQHLRRPADVMDRINEDLAKDSSRTGRFVSMFLVFIDLQKNELSWVRAGHEPAILFDPAEDRFYSLEGEGIVLGADETYRYQESNRQGWSPGTLLIIGTDGIHETRNAKGAYFGRQRLEEIIRRRHSAPVESIQAAVLADVAAFRGEMPQEDDITLVVVRLK